MISKLDALEKYCETAINFESFNKTGTQFVRNIITNTEGVFLQVGNEWIVTEGLQILGETMFVLVNAEWVTLAEALENPDCARANWKWEVCGFINFDDISACGVCGTPRPKKRG